MPNDENDRPIVEMHLGGAPPGSARQEAAAGSLSGRPRVPQEFGYELRALAEEWAPDEFLFLRWIPYRDGRKAAQPYTGRLDYSAPENRGDIVEALMGIAWARRWPGGHGILEAVFREAKTGRHRGQATWHLYLPEEALPHRRDDDDDDDDDDESLLETLTRWADTWEAHGPRLVERYGPLVAQGLALARGAIAEAGAPPPGPSKAPDPPPCYAWGSDDDGEEEEEEEGENDGDERD